MISLQKPEILTYVFLIIYDSQSAVWFLGWIFISNPVNNNLDLNCHDEYVLFPFWESATGDFLPPTNVVQEGNVFSRVRLSVRGMRGPHVTTTHDAESCMKMKEIVPRRVHVPSTVDPPLLCLYSLYIYR